MPSSPAPAARAAETFSVDDIAAAVLDHARAARTDIEAELDLLTEPASPEQDALLTQLRANVRQLVRLAEALPQAGPA